MLETGRSLGFKVLAKMPRYSSGTAPDFHRLPFYASLPEQIIVPVKHLFPFIFSSQKNRNLSARERKEVEINRAILFFSHLRLSRGF
jgi:hypothetical protein